MIVVIDASTFVSAAFKADSVPERALLRAIDPPNRLIPLQRGEDEYREVIFRPKSDRFVSVGWWQQLLDIVVVAAERIELTETVRECHDPKNDKYLALAAAGRADVIVSSDAVTCFRCILGAGFVSCLQQTISPSNDSKVALQRVARPRWLR